MAVESVQTFRFRNLQDRRLELDEGLNLISGENAAGKTNLLEAIYAGTRLASFRTSNLFELVRNGFESCRVVAGLSNEGASRIGVSIERKKRTAVVDGKPVRNRAELLSVTSVLSFCPDDLKMVKGEPSARRNFIDRMGSFLERGLADALRSYNRVLRQRNHLLKNWGACGSGDSYEVFTVQLAKKGIELHEARKRALALIERNAAVMYSALSSNQKELKLKMVSGFPRSVDMDEESLFEWFARQRAIEIERGRTIAGPHLDDFLIELDSMDARRYASQGEQRSCALAIMLGAVERYKKRKGADYTLLLDDLSSELDAGRRKRLFVLLEELGGQLVVTCADPAMVLDLPVEPSRHYRMSGGSAEVVA